MNKHMNDWPSNYMDIFWRHYPRRVAKKAAVRALEKVRKAGDVSFTDLMTGVVNYANAVIGKDMQYVCHPATWLNGGRWDDDVSAIAGGNSTADVGRGLLAKLRGEDCAAHDARRGGDGGDADAFGLPDISRH